MQHLDEGLIHAWLDNALPPDEAARVAAHAQECRECAAAVAEARGIIAGASRIVSALDIARGGAVPASPANTTRSLWRRLYLTPTRAAIAATLLLAVGSVFTLRHRPASDGLPVGRMIESPPPMVRRSVPSIAPPRVADSTHALTPAPLPAVRHVQATRDSAVSEPRVDAPRDTPSTRAAAAIPMAAKAIDAAADSAKTAQAAANLAQSQQKSVMAGAAGAATSARVSPAARSREATPAASSPPSAVTGTFAPTRLENAFLSTTGGICYTIQPLRGDTTTWLRALPERFALDNGSDRAGGNVRVPSSGGRVDSVVPGASWQQTGPGHITVVLDERRTIELHVATSPVSAEASSGGTTSAIAVARASCPR